MICKTLLKSTVPVTITLGMAASICFGKAKDSFEIEDASSANLVCAAAGGRFAIDTVGENFWEIAPFGDLAEALKQGVPANSVFTPKGSECQQCVEIDAEMNYGGFSLRFQVETFSEVDEQGIESIKANFKAAGEDTKVLTCELIP